MPDDSLDEMMLRFAAGAVEIARDFQIELDYSEGSLERVESILAQLHDQLRGWSAGRSTPDPYPTAEQIDSMCRLWGGYFGEVVRRRWGGEWSLESYPGRNFATPTLSIAAGKLFPTLKVYRRLMEGEQDNVWDYYQKIREKLQTSPGAAIQ